MCDQRFSESAPKERCRAPPVPLTTPPGSDPPASARGGRGSRAGGLLPSPARSLLSGAARGTHRSSRRAPAAPRAAGAQRSAGVVVQPGRKFKTDTQSEDNHSKAKLCSLLSRGTVSANKDTARPPLAAYTCQMSESSRASPGNSAPASRRPAPSRRWGSAPLAQISTACCSGISNQPNWAPLA